MKILVAEDDPDVGQLLEVVFSGFGHEVFIAEDGQEAIAALDKRTYDVAVVDVMMPKVDGIEVIKHLRRHETAKHLPVVILTAKGNEEGHLNGYSAGADAYVTKPFRPVELHETVQEVVARKPKDRHRVREAERAKADFLRKLEHRF
ncbi:MAG: response regulator [Nitriliruptorales bacterium]|nr:response regulator [Nitriliruptorales bacterium]